MIKRSIGIMCHCCISATAWLSSSVQLVVVVVEYLYAPYVPHVLKVNKATNNGTNGAGYQY